MSDVIAAYVSEVARHLPARARADVARELNGLLRDQLRETAEASGRRADDAMKLELVRGLGRPADVAARYHPPLAIIDPSDSRSFVLAALIGFGVLGVLTEIANAYQGAATEVPDPFAWLGLLTVFFAFKAALQRRYPASSPDWTPPRTDPDAASRTGLAVGVLLTVVVLVAYCAPGTFVGLVTGGRLDPELFSYTESFRHWSRMIWIPLLLAAHVALQVAAAARRRWTASIRWADIAVQVILLLQIGWHLRSGHIFEAAAVDAAVRPILALLGLIWAIEAGVMIYREWGRVTVPPQAAAAPGTR